MEPRIEISREIKVIGKKMMMSFSLNTTFELWKGFMPGRKEIQNAIGTNFYSIQIYSPLFFDNFNSNTQFEKWAAIEVSDFETIPPEMEAFVLPGGLYAVFLYHGAASQAEQTFQYIFGTWIPNSGYSLDNRPHFEILGKKYKNEDPDSEEEIWIPIK